MKRPISPPKLYSELLPLLAQTLPFHHPYFLRPLSSLNLPPQMASTLNITAILTNLSEVEPLEPNCICCVRCRNCQHRMHYSVSVSPNSRSHKPMCPKCGNQAEMTLKLERRTPLTQADCTDIKWVSMTVQGLAVETMVPGNHGWRGTTVQHARPSLEFKLNQSGRYKTNVRGMKVRMRMKWRIARD